MKKFIILSLILFTSCNKDRTQNENNDQSSTDATSVNDNIKPDSSIQILKEDMLPEGHEKAKIIPKTFKKFGGLILQPTGYKSRNFNFAKIKKTLRLNIKDTFLTFFIREHHSTNDTLDFYSFSILWNSEIPDDETIKGLGVHHYLEPRYVDPELKIIDINKILSFDDESNIVTFDFGKSIFKYQVNFDYNKMFKSKIKK